ncbi:MAG: hypothetical protein KF824_06435 [Fimbriimonadaceae bacterium]|nr:MAG: hypothetical protein KF824_06435 [Fimbriimonadaceae bacterium]
MSPKTIFLIATRLVGLIFLLFAIPSAITAFMFYQKNNGDASYDLMTTIYMPVLSQGFIGVMLILLGPLFAFGFPEKERWETKINTLGLTVVGLRFVGFFYACQKLGSIFSVIASGEKGANTPVLADVVGLIVFALFGFFAPAIAAMLPGSTSLASSEAENQLPPESS